MRHKPVAWPVLSRGVSDRGREPGWADLVDDELVEERAPGQQRGRQELPAGARVLSKQQVP